MIGTVFGTLTNAPEIDGLYFNIYTTHGNLPTIENSTDELTGTGFDGIVGKIKF